MFHPFTYAALALYFAADTYAAKPSLVGKNPAPPTMVGIDFSSSMPRSKGPLRRPPGSSAKFAAALHAGPIPIPQGGALNTTPKNSTTPASCSSVPDADPSAATLLLCEREGCANCIGFDLAAAPHDVCNIPDSRGAYPLVPSFE